MKSKNILKPLLISLVFLAALLIGGSFNTGHSVQVSASRANTYDLSSWQGRISNHQARGLKHEVNFVILRAQDGTTPDIQFQHSAKEMARNNVPYGVYSYSLYHNNYQARNEAISLYNQAPQANFYVNDIEENDAGHRIASATKSWADQMKRLTTKPVVLYSSMSFIQRYLRPAQKRYDATWMAAYSSRRPVTPYKYNLWQYTSSHYSKTLGKNVDASKIIGHKPLSFWINSSGNQVSAIKSVPKVRHKLFTKRVTIVKRSTNHLSKREIREYHHELKKISRKFKHGRYRLSKKERKAVKIYQLRHGYAYHS